MGKTKKKKKAKGSQKQQHFQNPPFWSGDKGFSPDKIAGSTPKPQSFQPHFTSPVRKILP